MNRNKISNKISKHFSQQLIQVGKKFSLQTIETHIAIKKKVKI